MFIKVNLAFRMKSIITTNIGSFLINAIFIVFPNQTGQGEVCCIYAYVTNPDAFLDLA